MHIGGLFKSNCFDWNAQPVARISNEYQMSKLMAFLTNHFTVTHNRFMFIVPFLVCSFGHSFIMVKIREWKRHAQNAMRGFEQAQNRYAAIYYGCVNRNAVLQLNEPTQAY